MTVTEMLFVTMQYAGMLDYVFNSILMFYYLLTEVTL